MKPNVKVIHNADMTLFGCIVDGSPEKCNDGNTDCVWRGKAECFGERIHLKMLDRMNAREEIDYDLLPRLKQKPEVGGG